MLINSSLQPSKPVLTHTGLQQLHSSMEEGRQPILEMERTPSKSRTFIYIARAISLCQPLPLLHIESTALDVAHCSM